MSAIRTRLLYVVTAILSISTISPAHAAAVIRNSVWVPTPGPDAFFRDRLSSTDGSPISLTQAYAGGFSSALATSDNNGTAIASAAGFQSFYRAEAKNEFSSIFDFSPQTRGRITITVAGWTNATGAGWGDITSIVRLNGQVKAQSRVYSTENDVWDTPRPGLQRLRLRSSFAWRGGDTISIVNTASVAVFSEANEIGLATAYVDPAIDLASAVPEPTTWGMMIAGFGLIGAAMRRRVARPQTVSA